MVSTIDGSGRAGPRPPDDPFTGGGEVRRLCRALDWSATPLGPVQTWPPELCAVVRTVLESPFPMNLWCGDELVLIYNDAYCDVLGSKHPHALGRSGREIWREIWPGIAPHFDAIRRGGPPVFADDAPFVIERAGAGAVTAGEPNAWFTFSLSAVRDARGDIVAFLNIVSESTGRIQAERARAQALAEAERAEARLRDVFAQAPSFLAVLRGPDHVFEYVNNAYYQLVGQRELLGRPVMDALPELRGQGFEQLLTTVRESGQAYVGREVLVRVARDDGRPEPRYADFVYYPIIEASGESTGVVAHGYDVTDHVLARQDAQRSRAEAEHASQAKGVFLANMSHEIRTPINAVMGYADLLDAGIAGPLAERQAEYVQRIRASSRHLLRLVNDVLDFSKIEAGRMVVQHMPVALPGIVADALQMVAHEAEDRRLELVESLPDDLDALHFLGDEDRVRQVLLNLLSNALKFTAPGGTVTLRGRLVAEAPASLKLPRNGPWLVVEVEDTGQGIPPEDLPRIFEPFVQVEEGHTRSTGGTGLGLSISRRLMRMMDGELTVESTLGRGSRFAIWLVPTAGTAVTLRRDAGGDRQAPPPGSGAPTLAALESVGRLILASADQLEDELVSRLRSDPQLPEARQLDEARLADHLSSYLVTLAKGLTAIATSDVVLLSDSDDIQDTIARRHGRQRRKLGWARSSVEREYALLHDVLDAFLRRAIVREMSEDAGELLAVVHRLLEHAAAQSLAEFDGVADR